MEDIDSGEDSPVRAESHAPDSMICYPSLGCASGNSIDDCVCSIYERVLGWSEWHLEGICGQQRADHGIKCSNLCRHLESEES